MRHERRRGHACRAGNQPERSKSCEVHELISGARDAMSVKRVYGDPNEKNGLTVIPAATVRGGGGLGMGEVGTVIGPGRRLRAHGPPERSVDHRGRAGGLEAGDRRQPDHPRAARRADRDRGHRARPAGAFAAPSLFARAGPGSAGRPQLQRRVPRLARYLPRERPIGRAGRRETASPLCGSTRARAYDRRDGRDRAAHARAGRARRQRDLRARAAARARPRRRARLPRAAAAGRAGRRAAGCRPRSRPSTSRRGRCRSGWRR